MTAADHRLEKHSVAIAGHRTSITLEAAFWRALKGIAKERGRSLSELIAEVDRRRGDMEPPPNLSSALRVYVLSHIARRLGMTEALGTYDYVIVGGGTAGCLLANRLSADPDVSVLLLEAGGKDDYLWIHIPVGYLYCMGNPRTDWCFKTEAEAGLGGRAINYPRGKVLGGCSSINGMIYMRGQARDYDQWRQLGNQGWGWDDVLPFFRQHEDYVHGADEVHGAGGEWRIDRQRLHWPILDTIRDAAVEAGMPRVTDFNRGDNHGVAYFHVTQRGGIRVNTAKAFLKPVRNRRNLRIVSGAQAKRVLIENGRAVGVEAEVNGTDQIARARGEVILCAGAIGSPHLLELSGIGQPERLRDLGIDVVHALSGVGENLQDHLQLRLVYKIRNALTLNTLAANLWGKARIGLEYLLRQSGPMSMAPSQLGAFAKSDPSLETPDLEYHIQPLVARPLRRAAASLPRRHHERVQPAAREPRQRACGERAVRRVAVDPPQLSQHRARPAGGGVGDPPDAPHHADRADAAARAGRVQARPQLPERRRAGAGGRPDRHHHLPPRRHRQDGQRRQGRGRRPAARARHRRPARDRRLDHADHHLRQHQRARP